MFVHADRNGTSYQQFSHDRNQAFKLIGLSVLWFTLFILALAALGQAAGSLYMAATIIAAFCMLGRYVVRYTRARCA